ncbi:MAG: polysaccharide deacetylase family protein [Rickettsiales bacterium]
MIRLLLITFLSLWLPSAAFAEEVLPRVLIGLYDSRESEERMSFTHRFLEMPANHLGFDIHYYDINKPLPKLTDDVYGVVIWLSAGNAVAEAEPYLKWLDTVVASGKKLVIVENAGISGKHRERDSVLQHYNRILSYIGIQDSNQWHSITYRAKPTFIDRAIASFERPIGPVLPGFGHTHVIPGQATSYAKMTVPGQDEDNVVDLITTNANGGFVAEGYAIFHVVENNRSRIIQWFVNPFEFLRRALNVGMTPIPDVTTINGRRIFYSHIDGDGWNNLCEIEEYRKKRTISAEVVRKEIIEPYPDFAFTVGPVVGDLEMDCYGVKESKEVARKIFAMPNVDPSSHTHSHPLYWSFFRNYTPEKEEDLLDRYPTKPKNKRSLLEDLEDKANTQDWKTLANPDSYQNHLTLDVAPPRGRNDYNEDELFKGKFEHKQYETPRSYACTPFILDQEISGSIDRINELTPPGKKARLIQWSGDTSPYQEVLRITREAGLLNINGGDSRFDNEYPSYSSVSPIGLKLGRERQIYSSNSNENTYTNLWTGRFFGFRYLQTTVRNTESPIRVRPFNIYFHIYSGQKLASLKAVQENFEFARSQQLHPITATDYTLLANHYYDTKLIKLDNNRWKVKDRGTLETLRFDYAFSQSIDFSTSYGVLGQNYWQNSLYVSLDPDVKNPVISLKQNDKEGLLPVENTPYLVDSRWKIKGLHHGKSLLTFHAQGYGHGEMSWVMPESGNYLIKATKISDQKSPVFETKVKTNTENILRFSIEVMTPQEPLLVTIEKI